ncbi:hypothetical protein ADICYQ_4083 [Cyclobacterium qasimii M12-11B]|uniref:Uncharacterized protein n=1 Tax=Cyclobacterium qasimii M12-11B TaxID=641524 RepID=S7VB93_9BACT|nr:hypothetical protein ADICYQ_4083 [Cyclobacterium qasimii M12-11B]
MVKKFPGGKNGPDKKKRPTISGPGFHDSEFNYFQAGGYN